MAEVLAFKNPDRSIVVVAGNKTANQKQFAIAIAGKLVEVTLAAKSFNTFIIK